MTTPDYHKALAALREALDLQAKVGKADTIARFAGHARVTKRARDLLAALDAARGEAVATVQTITSLVGETRKCIIGPAEVIDSLPVGTAVYAAPPAAAVPADNVTPMRQPRADLARLVESINAVVYANGDGLSVTEAIGALELAKLELLKEQEQ